MRRKNLSAEEQAKICELLEAGWKHEAIAAEMGCARGSINYYALKFGISDPKRARKRSGRRIYYRHGKPVVPFSPDDDRRMMEMELRGVDRVTIARTLNRRPHVIQARLMTLSRYEAMEGDK